MQINSLAMPSYLKGLLCIPQELQYSKKTLNMRSR
jgi:hypothetical protein